MKLKPISVNVMIVVVILILNIAGSCRKKKDIPAGNPRFVNENIIKLGPRTIWIDSLTAGYLSVLGDDNLEFNNVTNQLQSIKPGDILVSGIGPNAPYGLFCRIVAVERRSAITKFTTARATFAEAFEKLKISRHYDFSLADTAAKLDFVISIPSLKIHDKLRLSGEYKFSPGLSLDIDIENFVVRHIRLAANFQSETNLSMVAEKDLAGFSKEQNLYSKALKPIVIPETPIVVFPVLIVDIGANGSAKVAVSVSYENSTNTEHFIEYDGAWKTGHTKQKESRVSGTPEIKGEASLRAYVRAGMDLKFWGADFAKGNISATGSLEAEGQLTPFPDCKVSAAIHGDASLNASIFSNAFIAVSYPKIFEFTRLIYACAGCGTETTVTDIDGNVYPIIKIGNQCWMQENLKVSHYRNGDSIPEVVSSQVWSSQNTAFGAWCYWGNDPNSNNLYGKHYNWYAVMDSRGLCPVGWHVPDSTEWWTMINFLGGWQVAGASLKSTTNWYGGGGTNQSGFTALPGGWREPVFGNFLYGGNSASFWTTSYDPSYDCCNNPEYGKGAYNIVLLHNTSSVGMGSFNRKEGITVRCIKD